ncbi:MAG: ORF6N domain-containing protein [Ginsengibacter sp.]
MKIIMAKQKKDIQGIKADEKIIKKIYVIREQKVMLDFDLSALYEVETNYLKRQVRRNIDRFPEDFLFELTPEEYSSLRSQFGTLKRGEHSKYKPFAFTEQGLAMLSGIINSGKAIAMNIAIMRAFVAVRKYIFNYETLSKKIEELGQHIGEHDVQLDAIYTALENLMDDKVEKELKEKEWINRKKIGFKSGK